MSLRQAVRTFIHPGDTIHVAYTDARPNAALLELARSFAGSRPRFTIVTAGLVSVQHSLVQLGLVDRIIASFAGENYPVARPNPALTRALREGSVTIENWSLWSLIARLAAGALGVSHFPVRSLKGSDIGAEAAARGEYCELQVPGAEQRLGLVSALQPDVVLLHAAASAANGNLVLAAPYGEGAWGALAARRGVIATVERIVSTAKIRESSRLTKIPAHVVRAVCLTPYGAHPYGFNSPGLDEIGSYVEDTAFVGEVLAASKADDSFNEWIDKWILGLADHDEYLSALGSARLSTLNRDLREQGRHDQLDSWARYGEPPSALETQVVVAARRLIAAAKSRGADAVLAGVGLSNLAAWLGVRTLREVGLDVELMAEIGLFAYSPLPGEPFIFAGQNVPTNKVLTDVMSVLGTFIAGPATRSIGMLGAGQIDRGGAINSTYSQNGGYIVGSGGANDVASAADEVIVMVSNHPERMVEQVTYRTCPGHRVRTIVTDLAVFERSDPDDEFTLVALLPSADDDLEDALSTVQSRTGWPIKVAETVERELPPTEEELSTLRVFDPERLFLRTRGN